MTDQTSLTERIRALRSAMGIQFTGQFAENTINTLDAVLAALSDRSSPDGVGSGDFMIGGNLWPGLSKLIEECGEVVQVSGKLMGSAGDTNHWSGNIRQMLVEELGDLSAAQKFFEEHNLTEIEQRAVAARAAKKYAQFEQWHYHTKKASKPTD